MPDSVKLNEARERIKGCHQDLIDLETRAGIAEAAEKLRDEPPNYLGVYDAAEPYSDEKRELEQAEEAFHQQRTTRRIRDLYFAVRDAELRKALIAKDREEGNFALRYWQQELSDTAARLDKARSIHRHCRDAFLLFPAFPAPAVCGWRSGCRLAFLITAAL